MYAKDTHPLRNALWAPEPGWDVGTRLLAILLAANLRDGRVTTMPVARMAAYLSCSEATIYARLNRLIIDGWIKTVKRRRGAERKWLRITKVTKPGFIAAVQDWFEHSAIDDLTEGERLVSVMIAAHIGRKYATPGRDLLQQYSGLSESTVKRAIRNSQALGLFEVTERMGADGLQTSNSYRLLSEPEKRDGRSESFDMSARFGALLRAIDPELWHPTRSFALLIDYWHRKGMATRSQVAEAIEVLFEDPSRLDGVEPAYQALIKHQRELWDIIKDRNTSREAQDCA